MKQVTRHGWFYYKRHKNIICCDCCSCEFLYDDEDIEKLKLYDIDRDNHVPKVIYQPYVICPECGDIVYIRKEI